MATKRKTRKKTTRSTAASSSTSSMTTSSAKEAATLPRRILSYVMDFVILSTLAMLLGAMIGADLVGAMSAQIQAGQLTITNGSPLMTANLIWALMTIAYFTYFWSSAKDRGTPGQKLMGVAVVDAKGKTLTIGHAMKRSIAVLAYTIIFMIPAMGLGLSAQTITLLTILLILAAWMMVSMSPSKQGLHGKLTDTMVVQR